MASRRLVRQAAVQLLYARSASPKDQGGPEFWDLVNDRSGLTYDRARVKVLAHFQQGREATVAKLLAILTDSSAAILAADPGEKLAKDLKALATAELKWAESCSNLQRLTKADIGGWRRDLQKLLPGSDALRKNRAELLPKTEPFPPLQHNALKGIFEKLGEYDDRTRMVRFPENYPEQRDLDHLHRLVKEMKTLETETVERADLVEAAIVELDELINQTADNFDINRISKVDLAILRLATWEILKDPELDAAVSINEAIELARSFSGEESASFVNGLLDQIAKG
ncbi:MAG: transcription antitermination factor NusB [Paracoccaceae bacterium]|jgi:transcription antitermination factor NusB